jgi:hypothetical protein
MSVMAQRALGLLDYLHVDSESDALLDALVLALFDPADRLSLIAHGDGETTGPWATITDPTVAPLWAIPHAALWTGANPPARRVGETDSDYLARARVELSHPRGMLRGSARSLRIVAQQPQYLSGTRTVRIAERFGGALWQVGVLVLAAEVVDLAALTAAANDPDIIPAGMQAIVDFLPADSAWTVAEMESTYYDRTIADMEATFATVADLEEGPF